MVHLTAILIEIRAVAAAGGPRGDQQCRRLALRATKWISDCDRAEHLRQELTVALSANSFFKDLNEGEVQRQSLDDIDTVLALIKAESRVQ